MLAPAFPPGHVVRAGRSGSCRIVRFLGEGAQGSVYEAHVDASQAPLALKWYHPFAATSEQRRAIAALIERGAPDPRFIWPTELVESDGATGFGYVMGLRPPGYVSLGEVVRGTVAIDDAVATSVARELADSFLALHSEGLCYRDINFSNIFVEPATGRVLIVDIDNVGVDGGPSAVLGSRLFMAPEIVRGEATPSTATDLHALAVLLFYLLMVGHPLVGRREQRHWCWDEQAELELLGASPLFVFDPDDDRNAPVPGLHDAVIHNWWRYPGQVRQLFTTSFTAGLHDPDSRVRESVWRATMARLHDRVAQCTRCGMRYLFDPGTAPPICWSCGEAPHPPLWLAFDGSVVVLTETTVLHRHHVDLSYDFTEPVADIVEHPQRPGTWGLRNRSAARWRVVTPGGSVHSVGPGASARLVLGATYDFGPRSAVLTQDRAASPSPTADVTKQ